MSIKVVNVSKVYGEQIALNHISFEVGTAQVIGLLGPNGAGKSTMMKILAGFIPPSSGEVFINGLNIAQNSLEVRRMVGYLPEHNPLYLDLYVIEYLQLLASVYKLSTEPRKRVAEILDLVGLGTEQHKKIGQLSKGYRQRVGLAQALLHNPSILILDEPTAGLDPHQLATIRSLIMEVGKQKTVILSTHIMQEVEAMCQQVMIIKQGNIVAYDTPQHVRLQNKSQDLVIEIEFAEAVNPNIFDLIREIKEVRKANEKNYFLTSNIEQDIRPQLFQLSVKQGLTIIKIQLHEKPLEEIFRTLTK
ncbi:MAG: gliding motility-associated ABC transporter ATP-binding subunit GldA [Bacteroidales bacterium]